MTPTPTALIADDEPNLAQDLAHRLQQLWPGLEVVAITHNGIQAIAELNRLRSSQTDAEARAIAAIDAAARRIEALAEKAAS